MLGPVLAAIPARWASTRFPGKPLAPIAGRPMIAWVVRAALGARRVDDVAVVTDHRGVGRAAEAAGARAVVLDRPAASGSDRIAQLLAADRDAARAGVVVNLQGDEPLLEPEVIDAAIAALESRPGADVATLVRTARPGERLDDPNLVKVVRQADGRAADFVRQPVPDGEAKWIHVGLYAYRRPAFDRFAAAPPAARERAERLEQLRALELGLEIVTVEVETAAIAVDAPADIARVEAALAEIRSLDRPEAHG